MTGGLEVSQEPPKSSRKRRESIGGVKLVCKFPLIPTLRVAQRRRRPTAWERVNAETDGFDDGD